MTDIWLGLPATAQDVLLALAFLLPPTLLGWVLCRGFRTLPLVGALLRRYRAVNAAYLALIAVSVALGVGLTAQERGVQDASNRAAAPFDVVVAAPGNDVAVLLATVFLQPGAMPLLDLETYRAVASAEGVTLAAPLAFGDSYGSHPIIGTTAAFLSVLVDGPIEGAGWSDPFDAIVGADVPLAPGDTFAPSHGIGDGAEADAHAGEAFAVTGRLPRTGTPWDGAIVMPIEGLWGLHGFAGAAIPEDPDHDAGHHGPDTVLGPPFDTATFAGTPAIVVRTDTLGAAYGLQSRFTRNPGTMAFFPATVLGQLYRVMGDVRLALSLLTTVTQGLVAVGVLLGLVILARLFQRQMAMLRGLGAPRRFVFAVLWLYATSLIGAGALVGLALGQGAATVLSSHAGAATGLTIAPVLGWPELHLALGFWAAMSVLALIPPTLLSRGPILDGLRG